jgi:hypothetical protein
MNLFRSRARRAVVASHFIRLGVTHDCYGVSVVLARIGPVASALASWQSLSLGERSRIERIAHAHQVRVEVWLGADLGRDASRLIYVPHEVDASCGGGWRRFSWEDEYNDHVAESPEGWRFGFLYPMHERGYWVSEENRLNPAFVVREPIRTGTFAYVCRGLQSRIRDELAAGDAAARAWVKRMAA